MINETKAKIQTEARAMWNFYGRKGSLAIGTGVGKTKIVIDEILDLYKIHGDNLRVLVVFPTILLRDKGFPAECAEWGLTKEVYDKCVTSICYASLSTLKVGTHFHFVALDEVHHLTLANSVGLSNCTIDAIMGLSATPPDERDLEKSELVARFCPVVFEYSIDQGIEDGVSADFDLYIVECPLEAVKKTIPAGTKKNPFLVTEAKQYEFINKAITTILAIDPLSIDNWDEAMKFAVLRRTRFLYDLESKTVLARKILKMISQPDKRTLVFAGSITQAEKLSKYTHHSKKKKVKGQPSDYERFVNLEINELAAVDALDEGHNIPLLDQALIVKTNSKERTLKQRIGRVIRFREGHKGIVFLLMTPATVDEVWVKRAVSSIDPKRIFWISHRNFDHVVL